MPFPAPRERLIGALAGLSLLAIAVGGLAPWHRLDGLAGALAALNANMAPGLLLAGFLGGALVWALRAHRLGGALLILSLIGSGALVGRHVSHARVMAKDAAPNLRVLFFNVLHENQHDPALLAARIAETRADVVVVAEVAGLRTARAALQADYPYSGGCDGACGLQLFFKTPPQQLKLRFGTSFYDRRFVQVSMTSTSGAPVTLIAAHMLKPWIEGEAAGQQARLRALIAKIDGPVVVAGDFNAAPWSAAMHRLSAETGVQPALLPPATWPARAGAFGVPIDHVLVGGGARLTALQPFGGDLGSNHRGLLAEIAVPNGH